MRMDWEALSAIATLLAVFVALFHPSFLRWWNAPHLVLALRSRDQSTRFLNPVDEALRVERHRRILIKNTGRQAAHRVEVMITDGFKINDKTGELELLQDFLPIPLTWSGTSLSVCEYLPVGARLCDFGQHKISNPASPSDTFIIGRTRLGPGAYVLRLVVSASNADPSTLVLYVGIGEHRTPFIVSVASRDLRRRLRNIDKLEDEINSPFTSG